MLFVTEKEFLALKEKATSKPTDQAETYLFVKDSLFHAYYQEESEFWGMAFASQAEAFVYLEEDDRLSESDMKEGVKLKAQAEYQAFIKEATHKKPGEDLVDHSKKIYLKTLLYEHVTSPYFLRNFNHWFFKALLNPNAQILEDAYRMTFKDLDVDITEESLDQALRELDNLYL